MPATVYGRDLADRLSVSEEPECPFALNGAVAAMDFKPACLTSECHRGQSERQFLVAVDRKDGLLVFLSQFPETGAWH